MSDTQTLSRAKAALIIQHIDLVGITLCLESQGMETTENLKTSTISTLRYVRDLLANAYGLKIETVDSLTNDIGKHLTPAEEAELICDDLAQDDLTDE